MMVLLVKQVHLQNEGGDAANIEMIRALNAKERETRCMMASRIARERHRARAARMWS